MNDIHTRSADLAVRPRVSHVEQRDVASRSTKVDLAAAAKAAVVTGNETPVPAALPSSGTHSDAQVDARRSVEQAVARLNDYVQSLQRDIQFSIDPESNQPVVRVVDRGSQELIRQIPNETALRLARSLNARTLSSVGGAGNRPPSDIALFRAQA